MEQEKEIENLLAKVKNFKEADKIDLSYKEDLAVALMNLIALEEHFFFTYNKTGKEKYLEMLNEIRETRKKYFSQIVKNPEGEGWCISKHFLAGSMRLMEAGTKKLGAGDKETAKDLFANAYKLWNMFWGLNLGLIEESDLKMTEAESQEINLEKGKKASVFDALGKIIQKILDCCKE